MPRYQKAGEKKLWSIELDGKKYTTQFGKIGTTGQTRLETFKSEWDARDDYDRAAIGE